MRQDDWFVPSEPTALFFIFMRYCVSRKTENGYEYDTKFCFTRKQALKRADILNRIVEG